MKFAKRSEQNCIDDMFRKLNIVRSSPRPVYDLEDLNGTLIDWQFYGDELIPVRVTNRSVYKLDIILDKRYRNGILEYLVHWKSIGGFSTRGFLQPVWRKSVIGSGFYVILFSNSTMKAYPDNMISSFTVQLAHEIDLGMNSWEMVLCEFSCLRLKMAAKNRTLFSTIRTP